MFADILARGTLFGTAVALAACGSDDQRRQTSAGAPSTDTGSAAATVVTVTASDYAFEAPDRIPAGLTAFHLVSRGPSLHHVQLVKLEQGKTLDDLLATLKAGGPFPAWATMAGGPAPPPPRDTSVTISSLAPGEYALLCVIPGTDGVPHMMKGMSRALTVTGPSRPVETEPTADIVVKLVDYDFELARPLTAGKHTLRVENAGPQPHEIAIIRLETGKTPADFIKWTEKMSGPAPGTLHGGVSALVPGSHAFVEVDLPAGDYALVCFIPDGKDGKPHFMHGMAKQTKVS